MVVADDAVEWELASPPSDGVSSLTFSPGPTSSLFVTSWDKTARLYDPETNEERVKIECESPLISGTLSSPIEAFGGALDGTVHAFDLNTGTASALGAHGAAVRCASYSSGINAVVTGSWDKSICLWDPRTQQGSVGTAMLPDKAYTMDSNENRVIVGTAGRHVWIYDIRKLDTAEQRRESSLKFQTRTIRFNTAGNGYVLSSIDGRVAVEWLDPSEEAQKKKYAFKCHRVKIDGTDTIYPINAVAFHPRYGTFATGGCDGFVNIWDAAKKKRLCQFHKYPTSISALGFNHDGSLLAIASSYTFEEGEKDHPADAIYIRRTSEVETSATYN
eukprot:m.22144 g.22144  ORF g.22144 m.22144 type:complete len:331 (+) comp3959_c0_seq1:54-1046(+)